MKKSTVLSLLVLVALLVASCGPTPEPTKQPAPEATQAAGPEQTKEAAPAATEVPVATEKIQLRLAHAWPARLDPAIGGNFVDTTLYPNIYDTLLFPTTEGSVEPWVAESWEVSDDNLIYTFHLRQGVKFHDGSELLASDVVFSMNRLLTIGQGLAYLFSEHVAGVEALDDYTVQFTINEPHALFALALPRLYILNEDEVKAHMEAEGEYGEFGDYATGWMLTHDAGSGPYKVKDVQLEEYVLFEKNEDWWAADKFVENSPDEVRFIPAPEAATLRTLMVNRELDISDQWQSADTLESVDGIEGVDIAAFDAVTVMHIYMNTSRAPLDDVHCRRAVAYAFDYQTAAGLDWEGTPQSKGPTPMGLAGTDPNLTPYTFDLDKAREELAQCRYADAIADYPIEFNWVTEVPDEEKYALLVQHTLAQIGVTVEVVGMPFLTITELVTTKETTPSMIPAFVNADLPEAGQMLLLRYHSNSAGTFYQCEWLLDEELDAKIEEALRTLDQEERFRLYSEMEEYILDLCPTIFAFDQLQKHAYQTYLNWPAAQGTVYPMMGYNQFFAFIGVNPHE